MSAIIFLRFMTVIQHRIPSFVVIFTLNYLPSNILQLRNLRQPFLLKYSDVFMDGPLLRLKEIIKILHCSYDSLTLHDGETTSHPILGSFCGDTIPANQQSSSNNIVVHFDSDGSVTSSGFQLEHQRSST